MRTAEKISAFVGAILIALALLFFFDPVSYEEISLTGIVVAVYPPGSKAPNQVQMLVRLKDNEVVLASSPIIGGKISEKGDIVKLRKGKGVIFHRVSYVIQPG